MSASCLFCRIAAGEIEARVVREDDETVAFRDINPQAPTHVLIIPRRHVASIDAIEPADEALVGKLFSAARAIARAAGIAQSGYRVVMNAGADAGQSVDHIHLHLLGGRPLAWPPG
ncbi:MAG: histidine triad nucleotide-binding protein [Longimicrobiales bacterium]